MVVAKAELAQSYMHQLKMIFLRSFSIGPFYHYFVKVYSWPGFNTTTSTFGASRLVRSTNSLGS